MKLKVLVLGKGGREHALAEHLRQSPLLERLWVCPGNPGMARRGLACLPDDSPAALQRFCQEQEVDIVVPGPEAYMVGDLKAHLQQAGSYVFAPDPELARLESSKRFAKEVVQQAGLHTAAGQVIASLAEGRQALAEHDFAQGGIVLKADGLAQGKGVIVCAGRADAKAALTQLAGDHGFPILFEEQLAGPELSAFALCQGQRWRLLGTACDYKRIRPDPYSANTGGMGAHSPCDFIDDADRDAIAAIFTRTLETLAARGLRYEGFLFAGLMKTTHGLAVLEFNVRMGDPETQALLPRLDEDLLAALAQAKQGQLPAGTAQLRPDVAVHVVAASHGYPGKDMDLGHAITLPGDVSGISFAGVGQQGEALVNSGGRVLGVTALAPDKATARQRAYARLGGIAFQGMYARPDIAQ